MGYGRAMLWGAVAGLLIVALGVVGVVAVAPRMRSPMTMPGDRAMLVVAGHSGTDGSQVAQLVGIARFAGGKLSVGLVDPMTKVTVPGTTCEYLRDTYPFGGGPGVAKAYAAATGEEPLPVVTVSEDGVEDLVDRVGGIAVDVPVAASVFDGKRLYAFEPGQRKLSGAEMMALLSYAEYLKTPDEQTKLRLAVASGLMEGVASAPAGVRAGGVSSSLDARDLEDLEARLRDALAGATIAPVVR